MTEFDWIITLLTFFSVLLIPGIVLLFRLTVKWTRAEDKLGELAHDLRELVEDKNKVHSEMLIQMREDRAATDKRLRWLEENLWKFGSASGTRSGRPRS